MKGGEKVELKSNWTSYYVSNYCLGCIQQYLVGIKDQFIECIYSGWTNSTVESNCSIQFTAPQEKGVYLLEVPSSLDYSCKIRLDHLLGNYTNVIAYIIVE